MKESHVVNEEQIDLIELTKVVWSKRWFIIKATGLFVVLGLIMALTSPKEYRTSSTLIPEMVGQDGKLGGSLGGLASLAGVDLGGLSGGSTQSINPALYQSVSRSTPFLLELMDQKFYFIEVDEVLSIYDYYIFHYKKSLLGRILSVPGSIIHRVRGDANELRELSMPIDSSALRLTEDQKNIADDLRSRVFVEMDWELNVVTIEIEMQDPVVAAGMAHFTREYITNYVTNYAISKSKQQLQSLEKQYQERKLEFENSQIKLAAFRDRNQNVTTARAQSEEERLQSEYNLAFNVYSQLAQQREAIKLKIQENTPVFTVLEPVKIPVEKSKPNGIIIIIMFSLVGLASSVIFIIVKVVYEQSSNSYQ